MAISNYTYLLVDILCLLFPLIFSFHPKFKFISEFKNFILPSLVIAFVFILWDFIFTDMGIWTFNPNYILGIYLHNLPIEEILFFLFIPYACTFTYFCVDKYFPAKKSRGLDSVILLFIAILLLSVGLLNLKLAYTCITFISASILLFILLVLKVEFQRNFLITYLLIQIPFLISNGVLTGNFTDEAVVIYNNSENLGIRITTIPIEDLVYGFLLLILNVSGYEWMKKHRGVRILSSSL